MALNATELQPGDIVSYEDWKNYPRTYVIIEKPNEARPYDFKMVRVSGEDDFTVEWLQANYSDCRQYGWTLLKRNSDNM